MDSSFKALLASFQAWMLAGTDVLMDLLPDQAEAAAEPFLADARAQTGAGGLVSLVIGIAVAVIVAVGVAIPIVNDVIAQSNLTGLTAMIVGFIPVMLGVLIFVATVGPIMTRT